MGRVLNEDEATRLIFRASNRAKYPWHDWLNGEYWYLTEGKDFFGTTKAFRERCYRMQAQHGAVSVYVMDDGVILKGMRDGDRS